VDPNRTITRTGGQRSSQKRSSYLFLALRCDHPLDPGVRFRLDGIDAVELGRELGVGPSRFVRADHREQ